MASIVHITNKRSGVTYVYRSESYWDKQKKAPRNRRTLIGKVDPVTGDVVETKKRKHTQTDEVSAKLTPTYYEAMLEGMRTRLKSISSILVQLQSAISEADKFLDNKNGI